MSELTTIWNHAALTGASPPAPYVLPNMQGCSIKINNQSQYWLQITKAQTGVVVDKMEPYSFLILPNVKDMALKVDSSHPVSSLSPDTQMVDFSTMTGKEQYQKGSTQFNGASNVIIKGDVNIKNSQFNVNILGTPTFKIASGQQITIANSSLTVDIAGTPTFALAAGTSVNISNSNLPVTISGTPSFNVANSSLNVSLTGQNTVQLAAGASVNVSNSQLPVTISGTPNVNISNSSLTVDIAGTPTFKLASGTSVSVSSGSVKLSETANANIVNNFLVTGSYVYLGSQSWMEPGTSGATHSLTYNIPQNANKEYFGVNTFLLQIKTADSGITVGSVNALLDNGGMINGVLVDNPSGAWSSAIDTVYYLFSTGPQTLPFKQLQVQLVSGGGTPTDQVTLDIWALSEKGGAATGIVPGGVETFATTGAAVKIGTCAGFYLALQNQGAHTMSYYFGNVAPYNDGPALTLEPGQSVTYEGKFIPSGDLYAAGTAGENLAWMML